MATLDFWSQHLDRIQERSCSTSRSQLSDQQRSQKHSRAFRHSSRSSLTRGTDLRLCKTMYSLQESSKTKELRVIDGGNCTIRLSSASRGKMSKLSCSPPLSLCRSFPCYSPSAWLLQTPAPATYSDQTSKPAPWMRWLLAASACLVAGPHRSHPPLPPSSKAFVGPPNLLDARIGSPTSDPTKAKLKHPDHCSNAAKKKTTFSLTRSHASFEQLRQLSKAIQQACKFSPTLL